MYGNNYGTRREPADMDYPSYPIPSPFGTWPKLARRSVHSLTVKFEATARPFLQHFALSLPLQWGPWLVGHNGEKLDGAQDRG